MVGKYRRKSSRLQWSENDMQAAISVVQEKTMGWLLASKTFGVPSSTLRRRCRGTNQFSVGAAKGYMGGKRVTFNEDMETEIVEHIKNMEERFFGMTTSDVKKLAFDLAIQNGIPHQFNLEKKMAGDDWLKGFRRRNPQISLRMPESTSAARAMAFNKQKISKYFDLLERAMVEIDYDPLRIYNMDESGFSTVPSKNARIFAVKGRKQVGVLTSAERGKHFTVICATSAGGNYIPPCFIFPRKNMKHELMDNAPAGSIAFAQEHGWTNAEIFIKWLKYFVRIIKPTREQKVLLLIDGHTSHKTLEAQKYAKDNGILLFCFPPHCTHRVQPLDVSFFAPLTTYYNQELQKWLKSHPGRVVTHFQVGEIFREAYQKAATIKNATSGFEKTGIFPFNRDIFPDHLFHAAEVTEDVDTEQVRGVVETEVENVEGEATENERDTRIQSEERTDEEDNALTKTVESPLEEQINGDQHNVNNSSIDKFLIQPYKISPLPKAEVRNKRRSGNSGKFGVLNTTPEIEILKVKAAEKAKKELRRAAKKAKTVLKLGNSSSDEDIETDDNDDAACIYCNSLFSTSKAAEKWIRCIQCKKWAHCECADVSPRVKTFVCELCRC